MTQLQLSSSSSEPAKVNDGYQSNDKDIQQLALSDSEYTLQTWEDLTAIIGENRLGDLKRIPSDLKRYIAWSNKIREEYGSIKKFVLKQRLGWEDLNCRDPTPYADPEDTKILTNDWPYGNAPGILHLVAWTKSPIPTEPGKGDLTPEARAIVEKWVHDTFVTPLGKENVLWFKNWASIQSVRSVEHIHILVRGYTEEFLAGVVGNGAVDGTVRPVGRVGEGERTEGEGAEEGGVCRESGRAAAEERGGA